MHNVINCVLNYHAECVIRLKKDQKLSYLPF